MDGGSTDFTRSKYLPLRARSSMDDVQDAQVPRETGKSRAARVLRCEAPSA